MELYFGIAWSEFVVVCGSRIASQFGMLHMSLRFGLRALHSAIGRVHGCGFPVDCDRCLSVLRVACLAGTLTLFVACLRMHLLHCAFGSVATSPPTCGVDACGNTPSVAHMVFRQGARSCVVQAHNVRRLLV
jgi:hypothetical protein